MRITRIIKGFIATAFSVFCLFVGYATKSYIDKDLSTRRYTNPTKNLNIETYDGGGEALHPKCLYFRENWEGFNFWMVLTPYKGMNEAIENPCIYTSDNGINFTPFFLRIHSTLLHYLVKRNTTRTHTSYSIPN